MKDFKHKFFYVIFSLVTLSLVVSLSRQLVIHYRLNRQLAEKNDELSLLQERNLALKKTLEGAKSQKFLDEQARKLLGIGSPVALEEGETIQDEKEAEEKEPEVPNYQKWLNLFMY